MELFLLYLLLTFGAGVMLRNRPAWVRLLLLVAVCCFMAAAFFLERSVW